MALLSELTVNRYTGDGAQTVFNYQFKIFAAADLAVYVNDADGNPILQVAGYTVQGAGDPAGGTVTFAVAPANLRTVTLISEMPTTQPTQYPNNDKFPSKSHETGLDRAMRAIQQLKEKVSRQFSVPVDSTLTDLKIPDGPNPAGKSFRWNSAADAIELFDPTTFPAAVNPIIAKGDIFVGGTAGIASRLPVGSNNFFIVADSAQSLGLKWTDTFHDGSVSAPSVKLTDVGFFRRTAQELSLTINGAGQVRWGVNAMLLGTAHLLAWEGTGAWPQALDLSLARIGAGTLGQINSTNAQKLQLYETADGMPGSNWARLNLDALGATGFDIYTDKLGTGVHRKLRAYTKGNVEVELGVNNTMFWQLAQTSGNLTALNGARLAKSGLLRSVQVFTSNGTWNRPSGIRTVLVQVTSAGGGGGGTNGDNTVGCGGGGGAHTWKLIDVSAISSSTITVGTGGGGGAAANGNASAGGDSSWVDGTNTVSCTGGGGGSGAGTGTVGQAGTSTGGSVDHPGQPGGGGGTIGNLTIFDGHGGDCVMGPGARHASADSAGLGGSNYGGGGSGGWRVTTTNRAGGNGANGIIVVYEFE